MDPIAIFISPQIQIYTLGWFMMNYMCMGT